jgi:1-acyl-sn-glycerol-3-phosphate acyltransferase
VSEADALPIASLFPVRTVAMDYIRTTPIIGRIIRIHDPIWIGQPENVQSTSRNLTEAEIATFKETQREMLRKAVVEGTSQDDTASVLIFPEGVLTSGRYVYRNTACTVLVAYI